MSHVLSKIIIRNFRSIKDHTFELSPFTPLVGYNNAGKSNILTAIEWLLRKFALDESFFNDPSQQVEVVGTISGITDTLLDLMTAPQRNSITPYLSNETLTIRRTQSAPGGVANIRLFLQDATEIGNENEWKANPTGIDNALAALFPEPIRIAAMQDAGEDVSKSKTTSTIGKLLAEIIAPVQANHEQTITDALENVRALLDSDGENRAQELLDFDAEASAMVEAFFPGIRLKVHIPTPELKEVFTKGTIKVLEGPMENGKDIGTYGHGTQRSIQMALIKYLADKKREAVENASTTLLLIDEPELYLHPQAIEILRDALKRLSSEGYQVIFSTHSPSMVAPSDIPNTILVRKTEDRGTYCRSSLKSAVTSTVAGAPAQAGVLFSLSNAAEVLFAERVVLAEGKTERILLPQLVKKVTGQTLGMKKTALVTIDGCQNIKKTAEVLEAMDLPTKIICDLDYVLKDGEAHGFLTPGDPDVLAIKTTLASIAAAKGILLDGNGWPTKSPAFSAAEAFCELAAESAIQANVENLHKTAIANGVWFWRKGDFESHLEKIAKAESAWAMFCQRLDNEEFDTVLPNDHQELTDCINWIIA